MLVTRPKLLELKFVTGLLNWGVFVMLKASARNSKPTRSLIGNLRNSDASKSNSPGPLNAMRGAVPKALSGLWQSRWFRTRTSQYGFAKLAICVEPFPNPMPV